MSTFNRMRLIGFAAGSFFITSASALSQTTECLPNIPKNECDADLASEAYGNEFEDRFESWESEMAFDPYFYFSQVSWEVDWEARHKPMVVAIFGGFKSHPWAFAIEPVCTKIALLENGDCSLKLRIVTYKEGADFPDGKVPVGLDPFRPKSREEMALGLAVLVNWQEADLRTCKGAIEQVERLDDHVEPLWGQSFREWLGGAKIAPSDDIIVTMDGNSTVLEARSRPDPRKGHVYPQIESMRRWSGPNGAGFAVSWSRQMLAIVKPCLKPSSAVPPWENALAAHHQWDAKPLKH